MTFNLITRRSSVQICPPQPFRDPQGRNPGFRPSSCNWRRATHWVGHSDLSASQHSHIGVASEGEVCSHHSLLRCAPGSGRSIARLPAQFCNDVGRDGMLQKDGGKLRYGRRQPQMLRHDRKSFGTVRRNRTEFHSSLACPVLAVSHRRDRNRFASIRRNNPLFLHSNRVVSARSSDRSSNLIPSVRSL
jgi:hypothetical protein